MTPSSPDEILKVQTNMPQFNKGDTFADGQQVTGARLNNLIDGATLLVGAIADQPSITANTLEATDGLIVNDGGVLKKATISDVLNSELDAKLDVATIATLKSGQIEGVLGSDVNLVPLDGTAVTGKTFTSIDGITAIVTSVAHGLVTNMLLTFTASNPVYDGTYLITVLTADTFSYVITQTTPVAASGTLSYVKKGSVNVDGNVYVKEELNVGGRTNLNTLNVSSNSVFSGNTNFTGVFQVNGQVGYVLTEVIEETMNYYTNSSLPITWTNVMTTASYTKPAGEIWLIEAFVGYMRNMGPHLAVRLNQTTPATTHLVHLDTEGGGSQYFHPEAFQFSFVIQAATTFTSTFTIDARHAAVGYRIDFGQYNFSSFWAGVFTDVTPPPVRFRIYKYKTA